MENLILNFLPNKRYEKLMCEINFLKQRENEKVMTYVERTEKLKCRFHVVLRKGGDKVDTTMMRIRTMLMKNFVVVFRPEIRSKMRYEKISSKAKPFELLLNWSKA